MRVTHLTCLGRYDHPKALLIKSFEHLCALGLVHCSHKGGPAHKGLLTEQQMPLRLGVDSQTLHDWVKDHPELPLDVHRFGTQWTL